MSKESLTEIIHWNKDKWGKMTDKQLEDERKRLKSLANDYLYSYDVDKDLGYDDSYAFRELANESFKEAKAIKRYLKRR